MGAPTTADDLEHALPQFGIRWDAAGVDGSTERRRNFYTADGCIGQLSVPETINLARLLNRVSGAAEQLAAIQPTEEEALNAVSAAERDVGRVVYERLEKLMDAPSGTSEAAELGYLADLVGNVEEYGSWDGPAASPFVVAPKPLDPRDPDPSRPGIFRNHDCAGCSSGARPCREGKADGVGCSWPRARND